MNNKKYILIIPLILSLLIMLLSFNFELWIKFWRFLNVPSQLPPFADLDAISRALKSKLDGFNPFYNNPYDLAQKVYIYPSIWLYIFEFLRLNIEINFKLFCFVVIYIYIFVFLKIFSLLKDKKYQIILIFYFISTSNLLVLERLNNDIIIFILIYFLATSKNNLFKISLFFLSLFAKLYPIFSVFIFLRNKVNLILIILLSLISLYLIKDEISLLMNNGIEYALLASHGIPSISRAFWYYSTRYDFFIDDNNYSIFKYTLIFLTSIYATILFLINFKFKNKIIKKDISIVDSLLICGSGIFIGRFLTFGNFDYALIFLILTLPYFSRLDNKKLKFLYFFILFICFNSLLFEGGNRYSWLYFVKASIIHLFKIIIFSINCFYFGKVINDYLKINFKL